MLLTYINKTFLFAGLGIIKFYQAVIAPYLPLCCRFSLSCSEYAARSLVKYGLLKGTWLTGGRLLKCQAFYKRTEEESIIDE